MDRDAAGFMPRGGQFGYIFTKDFQGDAEILQTIAHELGHGKLLLKHTFDKDYGIAQGTTDNLMDYAKGKTHLAKWQWDILADPGIAQGVFDSDEDGMKAAAPAYASGIYVVGSDDFKRKVQTVLWDLMLRTSKGREMIQEILELLKKNTPPNLNIAENKRFNNNLLIMEETFSGVEYGHSGFGTVLSLNVNTTFYDPENGRGDAGITTSPMLSLAHELSHVLQRLNKENLGQICRSSENKSKYTNYVEALAVEIENIIRAQTKQILRTHYAGVKVFKIKSSDKYVYEIINGIQQSVKVLEIDSTTKSEDEFSQKYQKMNVEWTQTELDNWKRNCDITEEILQAVKGITDKDKNKDKKELKAWRIALK
jgi:hypothetical protein